EIAANGKSRNFINDTPVNLSQMKILAGSLVDLHQQFDTLDLGNENFQRDVMDALADNAPALLQLRTYVTAYQRTKKEWESFVSIQAEENKALDYNTFLFQELNELQLKENELEYLDAELKLLTHAEQVKQDLRAISYELIDSEQPLVQQLKYLQQKLQGLQE